MPAFEQSALRGTVHSIHGMHQGQASLEIVEVGPWPNNLKRLNASLRLP